MPTLPRDKDDKRRIIIDAASGKYKELTNCLNCGKVIAEEEGWGPCLFCGNPLEKSDAYGDRHGDDRGYIEPVGPTSSVADGDRHNASYEAAKATKDRLLSYDRDAKKRTRVFDDSTDWYSDAVNPWLSERQREEATRKATEEERRRREERRKIHATIDLFERTVVDTTAEVMEKMERENRDTFQKWTEDIAEQNKLLSMYEENYKGLRGQRPQLSGDSQQLYDRLRESLHATGRGFHNLPRQADEDGAAPEKKKNARWDASIDANRFEDEFTNASAPNLASTGTQGLKLLPVDESPYGDADDTGQCLSMHQPWASMLVYGFKRAEGRGWSTSHRGRLWIHAAAKAPEKGEIEELEERYQFLYESRGIPVPHLPSQCGGYPTSALLGCVDVEECFSQADYQAVLEANPSMPPEENGCEFVFWCLRPRRLVVPLKMGGDHKIWQLERGQLKAAQRGLRPVRWPAPATSSGSPASLDIPKKAVGGDAAAAAPAASATTVSPRRLDLWPAEAPKELLEAITKDRDADRQAVVLQDGFVHLVGFVPPDLQQCLVDELREPGISTGGFFSELSDGVKVSNGVSRMYLGMHWNTAGQRWERSRSNLDGGTPPAIPKLALDLYAEALKRANRELGSGANKKRKLTPFVEGKVPDIGIANFYPSSGATMQIHQDKMESKGSIDAGYAVMGICLGDSCDFVFSTEAPTTSQKPKVVRLESGDVYLLGGASRLLWHGVSRIVPQSAPPSLRLLPGRLSLTLRVH